MRKIFKHLHLWMSIPIGLIITVVCLTGAILVFQQEILEIANPSHYFVKEMKGEPIPLTRLIPLVNEQLEDNAVASIQIPSDPHRTYTATLRDGFRVSAFVDPYTGEVTGYYYFQKSSFYPVMSLHRWLMDSSRTWGKYAVGISTLLFVFILITGILLQPTLLKKSVWKIHTRKRGKRLLYDLHNALGLYAFIILITGALTGLMWSFDWYRNGVYLLFGAEVVQSGGNGAGQKRGQDQGKDARQMTTEQPAELSVVYWQDVLNELRVKNPDYDYIRIQEGSATVHPESAPHSRATDTYTFDNNSGEIYNATLYRDTPKSSRIFGWAYALHVGNFWGLWSKIPTFFASLIGASLPITGYWLYIRRFRRRRNKPRKPFYNHERR